eukprot:Rmarinus@m.29554
MLGQTSVADYGILEGAYGAQCLCGGWLADCMSRKQPASDLKPRHPSDFIVRQGRMKRLYGAMKKLSQALHCFGYQFQHPPIYDNPTRCIDFVCHRVDQLLVADVAPSLHGRPYNIPFRRWIKLILRHTNCVSLIAGIATNYCY